VETNKKMGERGGHKQITKTFLRNRVIHFSRLYTGKNNGQEPIWDKTPSGWPSHMTWNNPTSTPKDNVETLQEKYNFLYSAVENIPDSDKEAHNYFISGNMKAVDSYILCTKLIEQIKSFITNVEKNKILYSKDLSETLNELDTKISSLKPCSQKRRNEDPVEVRHKKIKTKDQNVKVANKTKQTGIGVLRTILPKSSHAASLAHSTDQVTSMPLQDVSVVINSASDNTVSNIDYFPKTLTYNAATVFHTSNNNLQNNSSKESLFQYVTPGPPLIHSTSNTNLQNNRSKEGIFQYITPGPSLIHFTFNTNLQNNSSEDSPKTSNFNSEISNNNNLSIDSGILSNESNNNNNLTLDITKLNKEDHKLLDDITKHSNTTENQDIFDPIIFMNFPVS
jgi:uncharacterized protein YdcH (DUF465 family)